MTLAELDYGTLQEHEVSAWAQLVTQALHFDLDAGTERWIRQQAGLSAFRVLRRGGELVAGLARLDSGHFLGGRAVPSSAIACVAVPPQHRGQGLASRLLLHCHRELRAEGVAVASLYPASLRVYRRSGYERAGSWTRYRMPLRGLPDFPPGLTARPLDPEHMGELRDIHGAHARETHGSLERVHPFLWSKMLEPRKGRAFAYILDADEDPEGYLIYEQPAFQQPVPVLDWAARTPRAAQGVLALLGSLRSLVPEALVPGAPVEPLFDLLPELSVTVERSQDWMLRLLDVPRALEARGYPPDLEAEVHLEVEDELLEWNSGAFALRVAEGRATVTPGGEARLRLGVRELACLYTGHRTPAEVALWGRLAGDRDALALLGRVFASPRPWMSDRF